MRWHLYTGAGQQGFTLLEALVAVALVSLIMLSAFGALRLGARSWETGVARTGATERLRLIQDNLRRELSQAVLMRPDPTDPRRVAFEGGRQEVRFVAPGPRSGGTAGLFDFDLRAERAGQGLRLVLYYEAHDPEATGFESTDSRRKVVLAEGLERLSFSYYGVLKQGGSPDWSDTWGDDADRLPALVRIRSDTIDGGQGWPELLVAVPAGGVG